MNASGPSTSLTSDTYNGSSPFLAVPVPLFIASGLDPRNEHTFTMEKAGAEYLDLDYVQTYKVGDGNGPPGGELNAQPPNNDQASLIGKIVGPILGKHLRVAHSRSAANIFTRFRGPCGPGGLHPPPAKTRGPQIVGERCGETRT